MVNIGISLKMLSMRIIKLGWRLLDYCYLSDDLFKDDLVVPVATKMFPANIEDPTIRGDILLQTFREIGEASLSTQDHQDGEMFLQSIEKNFSITRKLDNLQNTGECFLSLFFLLSAVLAFTKTRSLHDTDGHYHIMNWFCS